MEMIVVELDAGTRRIALTGRLDTAGVGQIEEASVGGLGLSMVRRAARRMSWRRDGAKNVVDVEIANERA